MKNYGKALKELRKKSNMTQSKLAETLNVTYQTVSKWENNVNTPDITIVETICNVFGITVDEFLRVAEVGDTPDNAENSASLSDNANTGGEERANEEVGALCPKCGAALVARYCPKCGYDTVGKQSADEREKVVPPSGSVEKSDLPVRKKLSKGKLAAIICASVVGFVAVVLAIVLPLILLLKPIGKKPTEPITPTNPITYTIAFNGNGSTGGTTNAVTFEDGESIVIPECGYTKTGYKFDGWMSINTQTLYRPNDTVKFDSSVTLKAKWTPIEYTVELYYEGETIRFIKKYDESFYLDDDVFEREGYYIDGWSYNGKVYDGTMASLTTVENAVVRLTPVWSVIEYTMVVNFGIQFDGVLFDNRLYGGRRTFGCCYGVNPLDTDGRRAPTADGFEFGGYTVYYSGPDDDGYMNSVYDGDMRYITFDIYVVMKWISQEYDIELRDAGVFEALETIEGCCGEEEYTLPLASTLFDDNYKPGYKFDKWLVRPYNLTEYVYFEDGATVSNLKIYGFHDSGDKHVVWLEARWKPIEYTVRFDGNGGVGSMSDLVCTFDEECALPPNGYSKTGYAFAGWEFDGRMYFFGDSVKNLTGTSGVVTMTACWVSPFDGAGTVDDPYRISDYDGLVAMSYAARGIEGFDSAHYILTADIDCGGKPLNAIFGYKNGCFSGVFDGNGHVIRNAVFAATYGYIGYDWPHYGNVKALFGGVINGSIKNVGIENYVIDGVDDSHRIAPLCGYYSSDTPIGRCYSSGTITLENPYVDGIAIGGLVADLHGGAADCYSSGKISLNYTVESGEQDMHTGCVGGFAATHSWYEGQKITTCYSDVDIDVIVSDNVSNIIERLYCGLFFAYGCNAENSFATGNIHCSRYGDPIDFTGVFGGFSHPSYSVLDNVYMSDDSGISFDDDPNGSITETFEQLSITSLDNLCSLDWLAANVGFDPSVWEEVGGELPRLKTFIG